MTQSDLPYAGVRIVDFSRLLPGAWCSQFLADCGADVIKLEHPVGGDYARHNPPTYRHTGVYFNSVNRNKRSVALDLRNPQSRPVVRRLLESADVVLESFRPGVPERLGIDYATARACNERVIYCSLTGFGQDGPLAEHAGHDLNIQGMTGLMTLGLEPGQLPRPPGFMAADYAGATVACMGIMMGLAARERSGQPLPGRVHVRCAAEHVQHCDDRAHVPPRRWCRTTHHGILGPKSALCRVRGGGWPAGFHIAAGAQVLEAVLRGDRPTGAVQRGRAATRTPHRPWRA